MPLPSLVVISFRMPAFWLLPRPEFSLFPAPHGQSIHNWAILLMLIRLYTVPPDRPSWARWRRGNQNSVDSIIRTNCNRIHSTYGRFWYIVSCFCTSCVSFAFNSYSTESSLLLSRRANGQELEVSDSLSTFDAWNALSHALTPRTSRIGSIIGLVRALTEARFEQCENNLTIKSMPTCTHNISLSALVH